MYEFYGGQASICPDCEEDDKEIIVTIIAAERGDDGYWQVRMQCPECGCEARGMMKQKE